MSSLRLAIPVILVVLWAGFSRPVVVRTQGTGTAPSATNARETLDRYCVTCHNQKTKTAGLTLDTLNVQVLDYAGLESIRPVVTYRKKAEK